MYNLRMERAYIRQLGEYLKDLEEGLDLRVCQGPSTLGDLNRLYEIIPHLRDAIYETNDQELATFLATLEFKARTCMHCIEDRLAVWN